MAKHLYAIGDIVVLKDGPVRMARVDGPCKVLATLPESGGSRQYRVRFENENFERCIPESDIDISRSKASARAPAPSRKEPSSWLKGSNVRIAK